MEIENVAEGAEEFTCNVWKVGERGLIDAGNDPVVLEGAEGVETVVITHTHYDHVENLEELVANQNPELYAFGPDNLEVQAEEVSDGDEVVLDGQHFRVLHTPGHRDDHICLYCPEERVLFSGDLIFSGEGFGRTDLEQGDRDTLIESIERIAALDVAAMYPGHGAPATENVNRQIKGSLEEARKREPKYQS